MICTSRARSILFSFFFLFLFPLSPPGSRCSGVGGVSSELRVGSCRVVGITCTGGYAIMSCSKFIGRFLGLLFIIFTFTVLVLCCFILFCSSLFSLCFVSFFACLL